MHDWGENFILCAQLVISFRVVRVYRIANGWREPQRPREPSIARPRVRSHIALANRRGPSEDNSALLALFLGGFLPHSAYRKQLGIHRY